MSVCPRSWKLSFFKFEETYVWPSNFIALVRLSLYVSSSVEGIFRYLLLNLLLRLNADIMGKKEKSSKRKSREAEVASEVLLHKSEFKYEISSDCFDDVKFRTFSWWCNYMLKTSLCVAEESCSFSYQ